MSGALECVGSPSFSVSIILEVARERCRADCSKYLIHLFLAFSVVVKVSGSSLLNV
jgi:hypothetical protein